jgi:hypothetical protein
MIVVKSNLARKMKNGVVCHSDKYNKMSFLKSQSNSIISYIVIILSAVDVTKYHGLI